MSGAPGRPGKIEPARPSIIFLVMSSGRSHLGKPKTDSNTHMTSSRTENAKSASSGSSESKSNKASLAYQRLFRFANVLVTQSLGLSASRVDCSSVESGQRSSAYLRLAYSISRRSNFEGSSRIPDI